MRTPLRGLLTLLLFSGLSSSAHALDLGDGSDGNCVWNGISVTARLWQCLDLDVSGSNTVPSSNDILDVRVQGTVTFTNGTLSADGNGPNRGAGGFNAGLGAAGSDGQDGLGPSGANGLGGQSVEDVSFLDNCDGAGGSGGRHSGQSAPSKGQDTSGNSATNCTPSPGLGGAAPTSSYGDPSNFRTLIRGGAGGGAGGSSDSAGTTAAGGDGGAGGGVIRIYAGGDINIDGTSSITVDGDDGSPGVAAGAGDAYSGGGGGGAGGSIYIVSLSQIEIVSGASLSASGGLGGTTADPGGDGSAGDVGYIRLEDSDGSIPGASGAASPSATVTTSTASSSRSAQLSLESDIAPGCALRKKGDWGPFWPSILALFILWMGLLKLTRTLKINHTSF